MRMINVASQRPGNLQYSRREETAGTTNVDVGAFPTLRTQARLC